VDPDPESGNRKTKMTYNYFIEGSDPVSDLDPTRLISFYRILYFTARSSECSVTQIWDRRSLRESNPQPVGVLAGHTDGITYLDTRGDGRFILSNSKDQVRHTSQSYSIQMDVP
jgi:hypothetical protein